MVAEVVATLCRAPVPAPYKRLEEVNDVAPVPPFATVSAEARVSEPSAAKLEVAVAPNFAVEPRKFEAKKLFVVDAASKDAPPVTPSFARGESHDDVAEPPITTWLVVVEG